MSSTDKKEDFLEFSPDSDHSDPHYSRRRKHQTSIVILSSILAIVFIFLCQCSDKIPSVQGPSLFRPTAYEVVPGFFAQSLTSTNDSLFDFVTSFVHHANGLDEIQFRTFKSEWSD
jgi:hypothetical protein